MSDIDVGRQKIAGAAQQLETVGGYIGQALQILEEAKGQAQSAAEGMSGSASVEEAVGLVAQAESDCETARQAVFAACNALEATANRL